ncbi:MAG: response regulator [Gammaproteobacteria bacterium]|nr:response regulator [Gammaproteobacteria bacterium]
MNSDKNENISAREDNRVGQPKIRKTLHLGFALILLLTVLIGVLGLYQLNKFKERIVEIVEVSNEKVSLAITMRDAILMRVFSAQKMLVTNDYFERDEELQNFYRLAGVYRVARNDLLRLKMVDEEKKLYQKLSRLVQFSQSISRQAVEILLEDPLPENANETLGAAISAQQQVLALLDQFVRLQDQYARHLVVAAKHEFQSTLLIIVGVVVVLLLVGAIMARKITNLISRKNIALFTKNVELEAAWFQAARATHEKSKFLANMSHELRTPLTSIIGFSETLLEPNQKKQDLYHAAEAIKHSGEHLHQIINDVLDVSKIEAGRMELEEIDVSVCDIVNDVCTMIEEKIKSKGLLLKNNYYFPLPKTIRADPTRLRQILLNLLGNAAKFTDAGTVAINTRYDPTLNLLKFDVIDTGVGISHHSQLKVFEPFSQAEKSTARHFGGTGLGLSISKKLAEKMRGDIVCHSKLGQGSTFSFVMSAGATNEFELIHELPISKRKKLSNKKVAGKARMVYAGNVLLAEDTPANQELISMILRKSGLKVDVVDNGRQAVDAALSRQYDLVLMDMQMPILGGIDAIKALRQRGYSIPIVMLTANALKQDKEICEQAGADGFLEKPINFPKFHQVLSYYLSSTPPEKAVSDLPNALQPTANLPLTSGACSLLNDCPQVASDDFLHDEELKGVLTSFMEKLPQMLAFIQQSAQQKNWQQLEAVSHELKGLGGSFGYHNLTKISSEINACAHRRVEGELANYIDALKREYSSICDKAKSNRIAG